MFAVKAKGKYQIEYKKSGSDSKKIAAEDVSFTDGEAVYTQYCAKLTKLQPNTKYKYRIVTEKDKGAWHELKTAGNKGFTAMIFADSQSDNYSQWHKIADKAYSENKKAELYLNLGDQVDNGQHQYQWKEWFNGVEQFSADIPMATLVGNHERYDLDWNKRFPEAYVNSIYLAP